MRRRRLRSALVVAIGAWLVIGLVPAPGSAATATWKVVLSPTSIGASLLPTTISMTFSNLGGPSGHDDLGCVRLQLPLAFTAVLPQVTDMPAGTHWAAYGINPILTHPNSGGDRLDADRPNDSVTVAIPVITLKSGTYSWTATAYRSQNCDDPFPDVFDLTVTVGGSATPKPTASPTPSPTPNATPKPTATPTTAPTPTPTPSQKPIGTPPPTAPPSIRPTTPPVGPTATPRPSASATPTATPAPTGSPPPSSGSTPAATPVGRGPSPSATLGATATPDPSDEPGAAIAVAGFDRGSSGGGSSGDGGPAIRLTSGFDTPFGQGFTWAVPGLVLAVPGLLVVLAVVVAQAVGAFAWLPIVRRRIGAFGLRSDGRSDRAT